MMAIDCGIKTFRMRQWEENSVKRKVWFRNRGKDGVLRIVGYGFLYITVDK